MPRQIITTANAPSSPLYSQAVKAGPHVHLSGIVGIDPVPDRAPRTRRGRVRP
jgi:enamine deaminase RidA (YjgF/YER057c/UK114 family)